jgi:Na/Pi-cotransporter
MNSIKVLNALAGIGMFFFSLRFLTVSLDDAISVRLEPLIRRFCRGTLRPMFAGIGLTVLVQASSITVISTMGFLSRGLISLEQSIFVTLGAAFGTTLKAWFFATNPTFIGPVLVVVSSVFLAFSRRRIVRKALEVVLAVGFIFLGWNMLGESLDSLSRFEGIISVVSHVQESSFFSLLLFLVLGFVFAILVQSSSTVVFLAIGLADHGALNVLTGSALVLGANIGTTITGMLVSLEYRSEVRRLALAHFLIKAIGAMMSLLLFRTFLFVVSFMMTPFIATLSVGEKLAAVHSCFNFMNLIIWTILSPLLIKMTYFFVPGSDSVAEVWMPGVIRKMLINAPKRALDEIRRREGRLFSEAKLLTDELFESLEKAVNTTQINFVQIEFSARFRVLEELLASLASQKNVFAPACWSMLRLMDRFELIVGELLELHELLSISTPQQLQKLAEVLGDDLDSLKSGFALAWNELRTGKSCETNCRNAILVLSQFEARLCKTVLHGGSVEESEIVLLERVISRFFRILTELENLGRTEFGKGHIIREQAPELPPTGLPVELVQLTSSAQGAGPGQEPA